MNLYNKTQFAGHFDTEIFNFTSISPRFTILRVELGLEF